MSKDTKDPQAAELPENLNPQSDLPPDADIEERFNDFWKRNGGGIFGGIAIGAAIVIGMQLFQYFDQRKEEGIRAAFAEVSGTEALLDFAAANPAHQLGALAGLQAADARYAEGGFDAAAALYAGAAKGFEDPTLVSRAQLGQGMSLLRAGARESGDALLRAVALDPAALEQTRGEAAYHMAVSRWEAGDIAGAREAIDIILALNAAPMWTFRGNALRERFTLAE